MNQPIHLAFCVDDNFCQHVATLVVTLQKYSHIHVHAHLVSSGLNETNLAALRSMITSMFSWSFYVVNEKKWGDLPISLQFGNRIDQTTYYRIALAELLPKDITKVLYMDADIITLGDIRQLWDTDIQGVAIAAVADGILSYQKRWLKIGLKHPHYFNAGMMLMNLSFWRENSLVEKTFSFLKKGVDWKYNDQDLLNLALNDCVKFVDTKWNVQSFHFRQNLTKQPIVVHFTESEKPWHISSLHPLQYNYLEARELSPYNNFSLEYYLDNFDQKLLDIAMQRIVSKVKVAIYGAGQRGRRLYHALKRDMPSVTVTVFIDKNILEPYQGVDVIFRMPDQEVDFVLVSSEAFQEEVIQQLKEWHVPHDKIINVSTHVDKIAIARKH